MLPLWIICVVSAVEVLVLLAVLLFFARLRRSEELMHTLQANQEALLQRLQLNAQLEHELVASFAQRQAELRNLDEKLEERSQELRRLLEQAEGITRSPRFLREIIANCRKQGLTAARTARRTGLSVDEVELILARMDEEDGRGTISTD